MRGLRRALARLRGVFHTGRAEREMAEEFQTHLEMEAEENLRRGMAPDEARRQASLKFGSLEAAKESYRDQRGLPWLEEARQDLSFTVRSFRKRPGWVVLSVLSLGFGIGLNAVVFTLLNAVWLNPLPGVRDARELVTINAASRGESGYSNSYADLEFIRNNSRSFEGLFAHELEMLSLSDGRSAEMTVGGIVNGNYFTVLETSMALGRGFLPEEDRVKDRDAVLVLGYDLWQRRFGADPAILGRKVELNRTPFTVIGVAAHGFAGVYGGLRQDFWIPLHMARAIDERKQDRLASGGWLQIMGRLKPGVSLERLQAELDGLSAQIRSAHRKGEDGYRAEAFPLHKAQRGLHSGMMEMAQVLAFGVVLVLLIACLNVSNLLLGRATERGREIAVRLSMGASRARVFRQLMTESLLLAAMGGAFGLLLAFWGRNITSLVPLGGMQIFLNMEIDWRVFGFLFTVSTAAAFLFGLTPALETTRVELAQMMRDGAGNVTAGIRGGRWRSGLVVGQVALSLAALAGAALFGRSLWKNVNAETGFRADGLVTAHVDLFAAGHPESRWRDFSKEMAARLGGTGAISQLAMTTFLPMSMGGGGNGRAFEVPGYSDPASRPRSVVVDAVSPGYLSVMGIGLVSGRDFGATDSADGAQVMLVNQAFARRFFAGREAVGASVKIGSTWRTIVGVHKDYVYRHPQTPVKPSVLLPLAQDPQARVILVARAAQSEAVAAAALRQGLREYDSLMPVMQLQSMNQHLRDRFAADRIATGALVFFGALASLLACIGLYGVLKTYVGQRWKEFGIRAGLGATPWELRRMVLARSWRLCGIGVALGLGLGAGFGKMIESSLAGVKGTDPLALALAAVLVLAASVISSLGPSRRAASVDPVAALRSE